MSSIHPLPNLDIYDGGPRVDRKESCGSSMSDGSPRVANDVDKEYYDGDDFDDMIAGVIPTKRRGQQQPSDYSEDEEEDPYDNEYQEDEEDGRMVDMTPDDAATNSDQDEVSLNSDDISGGSDISDVEEQRKSKRDKFVAPPLINDDESTVDMRPPAPVNQSVSSYVEALNQQQTRKNRIVKIGMLLILLGVIIGVALAIVSVNGNKIDASDGISAVDGGGGGGSSGLESNQISFKEGFTGNATTYSPSLSPIDFARGNTSSSTMEIVSPLPFPSLPPQTEPPTKSATFPPQSSLPTSRLSPAPIESMETGAPIASTDPPVTPEPTPAVSFEFGANEHLLLTLFHLNTLFIVMLLLYSPLPVQ
jgi:hypothetical protein